MSIEAEVANTLAHQDSVSKTLAATGGELIHPDHYAIREEIRLAVLEAIDSAMESRGRAYRMSDGELPYLFKTLDIISEKIWLKGIGL